MPMHESHFQPAISGTTANRFIQDLFDSSPG
jgi:hypothetical protein